MLLHLWFIKKQQIIRMKKLFLLTILFLLFFKINAQQLSFSDSSIVSLVTCSPGKEVYAKFGHTGIRINDPQNKIDVVFNYGIFSFETEDFYYKFIKGETDYYLGVNQTNVFLAEYARRNSMVWEQIINISVPEKRKLINALLKNYEPENRKYRYNFVFDNCATRPRDKILNSIDGFVQFQKDNDPKTYRQWVGVYVGDNTWLKFGIDLVFGMDADQTASQLESMFLPEVLMNEFQFAKELKPGITQPENLVKERKVLVNAENIDTEDQNWMYEPFFVFFVVMVVGLLSLFIEYNTAHYKPLVDSFCLLITGLAGVIVFYLMFFSTQPLVKNNLNLLWLNPLNLLASILIWIKPMRKSIFVYQMFNLGLLVLALIAMALSLQSFNTATYPIIALLLVRYARWFVRTKHKFDRKDKYRNKDRISGIR